MFLLCLFTKIAKMVPLGSTKLPTELKIDKRKALQVLFSMLVLHKAFFPCWCFTGSPFPAGALHGLLSVLVLHKCSTLVLPWQPNKMATFNWHLSSHDIITSINYLELRWVIEGNMTFLVMPLAWHRWVWNPLPPFSHRCSTTKLWGLTKQMNKKLQA